MKQAWNAWLLTYPSGKRGLKQCLTWLKLGKGAEKTVKSGWNLTSLFDFSVVKLVIQKAAFCDFVPHNQTLKWLSSLPILNYNARVILVVTVYSDRCIISLFPHLYTHPPLLPVPNKPYGFCGCKAPCLLWWLATCGCNRYWNEVLFIWTLNGTRTDNNTTVNRYIFFLLRITLNGLRTDNGTTVNRYIFFLLPSTETTYSLFDNLDHAILLRLESTFGILGVALSWFESYLSDTMQSVVVDGLMSLSLVFLRDRLLDLDYSPCIHNPCLMS